MALSVIDNTKPYPCMQGCHSKQERGSLMTVIYVAITISLLVFLPAGVAIGFCATCFIERMRGGRGGEREQRGVGKENKEQEVDYDEPVQPVEHLYQNQVNDQTAIRVSKNKAYGQTEPVETNISLFENQAYGQISTSTEFHS